MHGLILDLSLPFWQVQPDNAAATGARYPLAQPPGTPCPVLANLSPGIRPSARPAPGIRTIVALTPLHFRAPAELVAPARKSMGAVFLTPPFDPTAVLLDMPVTPLPFSFSL